MKKITIFICFCLFLVGCKNSNKILEELDTKTIHWSLNKDFEIRDIIKDLHYIVLEETPESIFSGIDKLIIKDDRIYLSDSGAKILLVFDISGKFLHKIGDQGDGPGEYSGASGMNFTVGENGDVFLYDYPRKVVLKFDANGKYINNQNSSYSFRDFILLPDDQFLLSLDIYENKNSNRKVLLTPDFKKIKSAYFHYHEDFRHNYGSNLVTFQQFNDKIAYMRPINDTLYIFNNEGFVEQAWYFDFGSKKMPEELKNDAEKLFEERQKGNHSTYVFRTPICIRNYIIAEIYDDGRKGIFIYDTAKNRSTHEIPSPDTFSLYNINMPLCAISDSVLVSYLDADTYYYVKDRLSISQEIDAHLLGGGTILCLYEFSPLGTEVRG